MSFFFFNGVTFGEARVDLPLLRGKMPSCSSLIASSFTSSLVSCSDFSSVMSLAEVLSDFSGALSEFSITAFAATSIVSSIISLAIGEDTFTDVIFSLRSTFWVLPSVFLALSTPLTLVEPVVSLVGFRLTFLGAINASKSASSALFCSTFEEVGRARIGMVGSTFTVLIGADWLCLGSTLLSDTMFGFLMDSAFFSTFLESLRLGSGLGSGTGSSIIFMSLPVSGSSTQLSSVRVGSLSSGSSTGFSLGSSGSIREGMSSITGVTDGKVFGVVIMDGTGVDVNIRPLPIVLSVEMVGLLRSKVPVDKAAALVTDCIECIGNADVAF